MCRSPGRGLGTHPQVEKDRNHVRVCGHPKWEADVTSLLDLYHDDTVI